VGHARRTRYAGEDGSLAGGRVARSFPSTALQVRPPEAPPRRPPHPAAANAFICGLRASCWRALALPWRLRLSTSRSFVAATVSLLCRSGAAMRPADSPVTTRAPLWSPERRFASLSPPGEHPFVLIALTQDSGDRDRSASGPRLCNRSEDEALAARRRRCRSNKRTRGREPREPRRH